MSMIDSDYLWVWDYDIVYVYFGDFYYIFEYVVGVMVN